MFSGRSSCRGAGTVPGWYELAGRFADGTLRQKSIMRWAGALNEEEKSNIERSTSRWNSRLESGPYF